MDALHSLTSWLHLDTLGSDYAFARWLFLRCVGIIYLIAFLSLWVQIKGLIGSQGILPMQEYLEAARQQLGWERFAYVPTVFWINASDIALHLACGASVACSMMVIFNVAPQINLFILWVLYLSIFKIGRDFLSFQWDTLLLETGFLAIFFAPIALRGGQAFIGTSSVVLILFWLLIFRLMFQSGVVKLTSGDISWRDLTALQYHYFTQPLPNPLSSFMHHFPQWFHTLSTIFMYAVELVLPLLIFTGSRLRIVAAAGITLLNLLIFATGNYTFFNLLTIVLCIPLIPDTAWQLVIPERLMQTVLETGAMGMFHALPLPIIGIIAAFIIFVGGIQTWRTLVPHSLNNRWLWHSIGWTQNLALVNSYGLFRTMTKERPEIIIEGSNDGLTWQAYEFSYKPGNTKRHPSFVAPHQPRLDWQMWFAALGPEEFSSWFRPFVRRLLEGSPDVLHLLEHNPFPDAPPRFIRAKRYLYTFTSPEEKRETGDSWDRKPDGMFLRVSTLPDSK